MNCIEHLCTPKEAMDLIRRTPASQTRLFVRVCCESTIGVLKGSVPLTRNQLKRLLDQTIVDTKVTAKIKITEHRWNLTKIKIVYFIG